MEKAHCKNEEVKGKIDAYRFVPNSSTLAVSNCAKIVIVSFLHNASLLFLVHFKAKALCYLIVLSPDIRHKFCVVPSNFIGWTFSTGPACW
jgi:hypothetical protein